MLDSANYALSHHALAPVATGIGIAFLGFAVLIRERCSFVSVVFWIMTWVGAVWLVSYGGYYCAQVESVAIGWIRLQNAGVVFIPSLVFLFTLASLGLFELHRNLSLLALGLSAGFVPVVLFTDWFVAGAYRYPFGFYTRYGPAVFPFLVLFLITMVCSLWLFWSEYQRSDSSTHRRRLQALLTAFSIAYLGSVDFLPAFGIPIYPFGFLAIAVFLVLAAQAIWRYRLIDITAAFAAQQILRIMADALIVLDREGILRVVNQAACELFGRAEPELLGKPIWMLDPAFFPREKMDRALRASVIQRYQAPLSVKGGTTLMLDISASSIPDEEGQPTGIVCIARVLGGTLQPQ